MTAATRVLDPTTQRWQLSTPRTWNGFEWIAERPDSRGFESLSVFSPEYLGAGTVLTRGVAGMPIAANSATLASWMHTNSPRPNSEAWGAKTSLNTSLFGTHPIPAYVVDSTDPSCEYQEMVAAGGSSEKGTSAYLVGRVPWPTWATPATMGDRSIAIYDRGTGIMREYFKVLPVVNQPGKWRAESGGYSVAEPGLGNLGETNYALQLREGTSAAVGMHNPLGFIGIAEAREKRIRHAVAFTCQDMSVGMSWPARGGDGLDTSGNAPFEGQWCRLPASVNPDDYKPFTALIIRAFQEFGGVATDKNRWCHAFNTESGYTEKHVFGVDPWSAEGDIHARYEGSLDVNDFPWHLTEWAPVDWGRPSPDFGLRTTDPTAWIRPD